MQHSIGYTLELAQATVSDVLSPNSQEIAIPLTRSPKCISMSVVRREEYRDETRMDSHIDGEPVAHHGHVMRLSKESQNRDVVREGNLVVRACDTDTKHRRPPTSVRPRTACNAKVASCQLKFSLFLAAESTDSAGAPGAELLLPDDEEKRDQDVSGVVFGWQVAPRVNNIHLNLVSGRVHAQVHHMMLHAYL